MKHNTTKSKELLMQALMTLPSDEALREARSYIRTAIAKIEHTEHKRAKREQTLNLHHQWNDNLKIGMTQLGAGTDGYDPKKALDAIENMIASEQKKLAANQNKKPDQDKPLFG